MKIQKNAWLFIIFSLFTACAVEEEPFVPVEDIIVAVPAISVGALVDLDTMGKIKPDNATPKQKHIEWTITDAGLTGAVIEENKLTATAQGTMKISARIVNGKAEGEDFVKEFTIGVYAGDSRFLYVTSNANEGQGSLREAINEWGENWTIVIDPSLETIELTGCLEIKKNLTIEGNGVTITRSPEWTAPLWTTKLMEISGYRKVTIRRIHFKDGKASSGALNQENANLILESCIFSGNQDSALFGFHGSISVRGCTFYGNNSSLAGGAISYSQSSFDDNSTLNLTGNVFYGNTADRRPIVSAIRYIGISGGYNVVDADFGTEDNQCGWTAANGDINVSRPPISPVSFKLLPNSEAVGIITQLPKDYPALDFFGNPITAPASAGAIQATTTEGGYMLATTVNDRIRGSVNAAPGPNAEGLYPANVTVTASPADGCEFAYWLVDGAKAGETSPLTLTLTNRSHVQAVFKFKIDNFTSDSANEPGTLRRALANIQEGETISLSGVTPGETVIYLTGRLPNITKNIVIEGNGVTITRDPSWTTIDDNSQLMYIGGTATVTISHIHFKDGRAVDKGGAIYNNGGMLTLESCIFSGNKTENSSTFGSDGGAIYSYNSSSAQNLNVRACTFYGNSAGAGGAIYNQNGGLTITGNLFYGNTASYVLGGDVVGGHGATSLGYNVVDKTMGQGVGDSKWIAAIGDRTLADLGISGIPINTTTFAPVSGLSTVIPSLPEGFPTTDFYGATRTFAGAPGAVK